MPNFWAYREKRVAYAQEILYLYGNISLLERVVVILENVYNICVVRFTVCCVIETLFMQIRFTMCGTETLFTPTLGVRLRGFLLRCFGCIDKFLRIRPIFGCIQKIFAIHPKWFASTCFDSPFYWTAVRLYSYCKMLLLHEGVQYGYICCDFADFSFYLYDCLGVSSYSVLSA